MRQLVINNLSRLLILLSRVPESFNRLFGNAKKAKPKSQLSNAEFHLTRKEISKLTAAACCPRDRVLIQLMAETGMRRGEVAALRLSDIDEARSLILIRNGKGCKTRHVPVSKTLVKGMLLLCDANDGIVFASTGNEPLSLRQVNRIVAAAGTTAEIKNPNPKYRFITCHLLRHTFARHWKDNGGSIETLSKILGHSSIKTTWDQYGTESLEDVRRNYQKTIKLMTAVKE